MYMYIRTYVHKYVHPYIVEMYVLYNTYTVCTYTYTYVRMYLWSLIYIDPVDLSMTGMLVL